ncbi:MAG: DUF1456 family protein [Balneolaceae bacterium]
MRNDDIISSIRYMLDLPDGGVAEILTLGGYTPKRGDVEAIFKRPKPTVTRIDGSTAEEDTPDDLTAHFLDGLIIYRRGKSDDHPPQPIETPVTNNTVLKKLRVALELKEKEMLEMIQQGGVTLSASEFRAFFRDRMHRNYRPAGDQVLRYFLKAATEKLRG